MDRDRKLYRASKDKMICGVCGGLGDYLNVDPTLIRLLWVLLTCWAGMSIVAYLVAAIIIPMEPPEL
ncbi:MAG: PspC domain-containing protein [Lachnospiraceae bacterium]|jgi:phage shock protein C|nr:PspC domain-containing protein [Lachnospiraceae bacterium]